MLNIIIVICGSLLAVAGVVAVLVITRRIDTIQQALEHNCKITNVAIDAFQRIVEEAQRTSELLNATDDNSENVK